MIQPETEPAANSSAREGAAHGTQPERPSQWLKARRAIDVIVVLVTAPVTVPLGLLTMLAVLIQDRAIPLVRINRVGRHGTLLQIVKIRTMRNVQGSGPSITSSTDSRVTQLGSVLRSLRLDELPQLVSVLSGKLALIGPRPETAMFVDLSDDNWNTALSVRPGIAGITQIVASPWEATELDLTNPEARYRDVAVPAKLAIDVWYANNASLRLDAVICTSLISMMVFGRTWTRAHELVAENVPAAEPLLARFRPDA